MKRNKTKRRLRLLIIFLLILGIGGFFAYKQGLLDNYLSENLTYKVAVEKRSYKVYNINSDERPIAVMIDNIKSAWPQTGLKDAYLIYEIIVEGGQTRLMALFKDKSTAQVGPIRSARHYYLDYAMENDAIYTHFGGSPKAYTDIKSLAINDLDGINTSGFTKRDTTRKAPHNVYGDLVAMKTVATNKKNYRMTTTQTPLLPYSYNTIDLSELETAKVANNITLKYSAYHTTTYRYDSESKMYFRAMNGIDHKDRITGERYQFKNIIIQKLQNDKLIDNSAKDRQEVYTVGEGQGYYVTNGYYIPITWSKASRNAKTIYKDLDGDKIKINDGTTFIQLQPKTQPTTLV